MSWRLFRVSYELLSPLHIGYHKIGKLLQRTRYYIPARNLWAAATERLVRSGFHWDNNKEVNYREVGDKLKEHAAFSYFFIENHKGLMNPTFTEKGLYYYGKVSEAKFERCFLSAHVTTALNASTTSAEEASLHEVEFISPFNLQDEHNRVSVGGWVWLDEEGFDKLGHDKWMQWLGELQVGGERRYGFGRMRMKDDLKEENELNCCKVILNSRRPRIQVAAKKFLLAHTLVSDDLKVSGMIEPIVGRETNGNSSCFGSVLTRAGVCWAPGSMVDDSCEIQICTDGLWEKISMNPKTL